MRYYDTYSHLLGLPYDEGDADCYGLGRRFYLSLYQIEIPNYARSSAFFGSHVDLFKSFLQETDFESVDCSLDKLQFGDGLLLAVPHRTTPIGMVNHLAVFVGNGTFLHHPFGRPSCEDYMTPQWKRRVVNVVRSYEVTRANDELFRQSSVDILSLVPDHVKRKLSVAATPVVEPNNGEVRAPDEGRSNTGNPEPVPDPIKQRVGTSKRGRAAAT